VEKEQQSQTTEHNTAQTQTQKSELLYHINKRPSNRPKTSP